MLIKELYNSNEPITIESYLEKYGVADVEEFLNPTGKYLDNCLLYADIKDAVQLLKWEYISEVSRILIVQDCDVDGICSAYEVYDYLSRLSDHWEIKVALHTGKQRGLEDTDIMMEIENFKPTLVIVPDAGTNNQSQAVLLAMMNISLIVLDHHDFDTPITYGALVNNQNPKNVGVSKNGSGALVAHKFLQALDIEFNKHFQKIMWTLWH